MPLFSRKNKTAEIAKAVAEELNKAGAYGGAGANGPYGGSLPQSLMGTPMYNQTGYANVVPAEPTSGGQGLAQQSGWVAQSLERPGSAFGSMLGPAAPLLPSPIDPLNPETGRAEPRLWQYEVATNLNLTQTDVPWGTLRSLAETCDIIARAITIRVGDMTKMDWSFTLSDDAITEIMAEQNVSHAKAATIGREKYGEKIAQLTEFWENPYPELHRGWSEWVTEAAWNHLVYDAIVVYPKYNLGGKLIGFELIDPTTIKVLLDNYGRRPVYPAPAFQQILWGFPRGEFTSSPMSDVDGEFYDTTQHPNVRPTDSLAYFVKNRRTWSPYGFSPVEQSIPWASIYLERQNWLISEYQQGSMPMTWMETDSDEIDHLKLAAFERVFNDKITGSTAERYKVKVLPKGFKPVQSAQIDEKYKSDYDEFLAKRIAAIFGVSPSQLGVIARAGLGGGKGQQDGETQSAETVSSKPMEKFIVEMVNNLCKRFLDMDDNITFNLSDDSNAQNEELMAKAAQTNLFSGIATLNDVRGELGLPLYDMPEADEPFIVAGQTIQFLKGQLAVDQSGETVGQKEQPLDEAHQVANGQNQSSPSDQEVQVNPSDGKAPETPVGYKNGQENVTTSGKSAELEAFNAYVKKRQKIGKWTRDFEFKSIEASQAKALNDSGKALVERSDNPKGLSLTKASSDELPDQATKAALENKHRASILAGLNKSITGVSQAIKQALSQPATDPNHIKSIVNLAMMQNVKADGTKLGDAIAALHQEAIEAGINFNAAILGIEAQPGQNVADLLAKRNITLKGINQTTMDRINTAIRTGMAQGSTARDIGTVVNAIINDPSRADIIAITETNRAYNAGAVDTYQQAGIQQFQWISYDGACPECLEQTGIHNLGDDYPPEHPSCRCAIVPVTSSGETQ